MSHVQIIYLSINMQRLIYSACEHQEGEKVLVEDIDADLYAAITQAAGRLGRAVARALERRREHSLYMPVASRMPAAQVLRRQARTRNAPE